MSTSSGRRRRQVVGWGAGIGALASLGVRSVGAQGALPPGVARVEVASPGARIGVFSAPGGSALLTRLPADAQVQVTGEARDAQEEPWYAIRLWNALDGFVRQDAVAFTPAPLKAPGAGGTPWQPPAVPAQGPFPLETSAVARAGWEFAAAPEGPGIGALTPGERLRVTAWATDGAGRAWYGFAAAQRAGTAGSGSGTGWTVASALTLEPPAAPSAGPTAGAPVHNVAGKGMWFTYDVVRETPPQHLVATALANGFAFLAPEVGTSRRGYWAGAELDALLVAAHSAGLRVIPWIYTWLADLPGDLDLAVRAAGHLAPGGHTPDGIAVDIEEHLEEERVRAFGQLLRSALGTGRLLVAITFQPQHTQGRRTPFGAIAESFDVVAPMSYWHLRNVPYSASEAHSYVAESVRLIRERSGRPDLPVAVLGQTFDWFTRNEIGAGNPTAEELRGAMQGAREAGALGIGFFNWYSTTPEEWQAIGEFPW